MRILLLPLLLVALLGLGSCADEKSEVQRLIEGDAQVIDVRTPEEFADGHVEGAVNIDLAADDFRERVDALPRDRYYVVYCESGRRAAQAVATMQGLGFGSVVNAGGYDTLVELGVDTGT